MHIIVNLLKIKDMEKMLKETRKKKEKHKYRGTMQARNNEVVFLKQCNKKKKSVNQKLFTQ